MIVFVTGGARSGKSGFALREASAIKGDKCFIATAEGRDGEMCLRIEAHQRERGPKWRTVEAPLKLPEALLSTPADVVLIDCLTMWVSNLLLAGLDMEMEFQRFADALQNTGDKSVFVVSNEVGMSVVPENRLARQFRDYTGTINQKTAELALEAWLVVSGIAVKLKGESRV